MGFFDTDPTTQPKPATDSPNWSTTGGSPPNQVASFLSPITNAIGASPVAKGSATITGAKSTGVFSPKTAWVLADSSTGSIKTLSAIDPFFRFPKIDPADFNKIYAYEFRVWNVKNTGEQYFIILPMPPQSISVDVPAASTITATMKGVTEDANGAPLRRISIVGTSGINWSPVHLTNPEAGPGQFDVQKNLQYAFKNTINAAKGAASAIGKAISAFKGGQDVPPEPAPLNRSIDQPATQLNTGYVFFHELARFFDFYLALKKTMKGKDYRLTFSMHKDKMYYDCILNGYSFTKSPGTTEYQYRINLTAYRRRADPIKPVKESNPNYLQTQADKMSLLASITQGLLQTRIALYKLAAVLSGVNADIKATFLEPINQACLCLGAFNNMNQTVLDFLGSLNSPGFKNAIKAYVKNEKLASQTTSSQMQAMILKVGQYGSLNKSIASSENTFAADIPTVNAATEATKNSAANNTTAENAIKDFANKNVIAVDKAKKLQEGLKSSNETSAAQPTVLGDKTADVLKAMFSQPYEYTDIWSKIVLSSLTIAAIDMDKLQATVQTVEQMLAKQEAFIKGLQDAYDLTEKALVPTITNTSTSETAQEGGELVFNENGTTSAEVIAILKPMNDAIIQVANMFATLSTVVPVEDDADYASYYKDYAIANGIQFSDSASKFYIPYPYGSTLESLALQYLGDPSAWIEIAAVNGLKPPYVDETGYDIPMIAAGAGNTVIIGNAVRLYVGQIVSLKSDKVLSEMRRIDKITVYSAAETILTLEGDPSLARFVMADNPKVHAFLPDTVNSTKLIAIPSESPVSIPGVFKSSPNSPQDVDYVGRIAKVDFLLKTDGSLVFEGGDIKLSVGYQNLLQAALIKLQTKRGSLVHDPSFGNPLSAGVSIAEINLQSALDSIRNMFTEDARFSGLRAARVTAVGPTMGMDVMLEISGSDIYLPLTVELPK